MGPDNNASGDADRPVPGCAAYRAATEKICISDAGTARKGCPTGTGKRVWETANAEYAVPGFRQVASSAEMVYGTTV
jgi:hypothetical protein